MNISNNYASYIEYDIKNLVFSNETLNDCYHNSKRFSSNLFLQNIDEKEIRSK